MANKRSSKHDGPRGKGLSGLPSGYGVDCVHWASMPPVRVWYPAHTCWWWAAVNCELLFARSLPPVGVGVPALLRHSLEYI